MLNKETLKIVVLSSLIAVGAGAASANTNGSSTFEKIDSNGDGQVSQEELRKLAEDRFAKADADNDGFVTPAEMMAARVGNRAERMLERYDADGNGQLSAEELQEASKSRGEKRAKKMVARMDTNNDGKLSLEEMQSSRDPGKMFDRLDKDGNGSLSAEEFAKIKEHRKDRRKK